MELAEAMGFKAYIGKVNMDRNAPDYLLEDTDRSLADTEELAVRCREALHKVRFIATPRFVPSTTEKLMTGLGRSIPTCRLIRPSMIPLASCGPKRPSWPMPSIYQTKKNVYFAIKAFT